MIWHRGLHTRWSLVIRGQSCTECVHIGVRNSETILQISHRVASHIDCISMQNSELLVSYKSRTEYRCMPVSVCDSHVIRNSHLQVLHFDYFHCSVTHLLLTLQCSEISTPYKSCIAVLALGCSWVYALVIMDILWSWLHNTVGFHRPTNQAQRVLTLGCSWVCASHHKASRGGHFTASS